MTKSRLWMFLLVIVVSWGLCRLASAGALTLEECIRWGLAQNPQVHAYALAVDEADQEILEAWGAFLPTLSMGYNYNQLSNSNSSTERDSDYLDQNSDNFNVRLTQPLFTGFSGMAGLKRARQSREFRLTELRFMRQQLVREIQTSFYTHLQAARRADQWVASVERLQRQKDIAAAWVGQRMAPRLRLLETEVELSNARHQLIRAQSEREIAAAQLRQWLAMDAFAYLELRGDFDDERFDRCANLTDCLDLALQQRPDLELARLNIDMARQDARGILARNLPQAHLEGSYTDYHRTYDDSRYPDDDRDYYSVTLNLSLKPFQGGRNIAAWRRQRIAIDRYEQQLSAARHQVSSDVETRYREMIEARARIANAQDTLKEARAAYEVASRSAELGVVSLDDLLAAELRLTRAEIDLIDSRAARVLARVLLEYAIGAPVPY